MTDVLIGAVVIAAMVGVGVAIVSTARRQRQEKSGAFREAARLLGFDFEDDGDAVFLAQGMGEFAVFRSPSLGERRPTNVITSRRPDESTIAFLHATRAHPGDARLHYVAVSQRADTRACPSLIRLRSRRPNRPHQVYPGETDVEFEDHPEFQRLYRVVSEDETVARDLLSPELREALVAWDADTGFPVDLSLLDHRTAAVNAERNQDLTPAQIVRLVDVVRRVGEQRP